MTQLYLPAPDIGRYLNRVTCSEATDFLRGLPTGSVQTLITSPPYYGLRDYGTATWDGGNPDCNHRVGNQVQDSKAPGAITYGVRPGIDASTCKLCGAKRIDDQIGLEGTPAEFVAKLVAVFREARRVLRDDGTIWINLGDSYATSGGNRNGNMQGAESSGVRKGGNKPPGYAEKNLMGIPWRVAFALQDDGWILRSDIIWAKNNPMPESVTDRPTKAHEYVFLLSKKPHYYYDADAIKEPVTGNGASRGTFRGGDSYTHDYAFQNGAARREPTDKGKDKLIVEDRNKRTVWTVATEPTPFAHFATFPTKLITPMILAGAPVGGIVLDPFAGSGTTLLVARNLGRVGIGCDLNPEYAALANDRLSKPWTMPMLEMFA